MPYFKLEFDVVCYCGVKLQTLYIDGYKIPAIKVVPCKKCLALANADGYHRGRNALEKDNNQWRSFND